MDAITTENLTKVYRSRFGRAKDPSLDALDLRVAENEVFGFLGRNGAGKTTTIKLLCSLLQPTRGRASILGENARRRTARRLVGYLPENPYFYEYLTPRETLDFYGRLHGLNARARADEWDKLAELLELGPIAGQRVREFSKGMRQRLAFAVALVGDPPVLILDEPMSGLDPLGRREARNLMLRLRDEKKTVFFSTHILSDVQEICDRVGILAKGRLMAHGRIDELVTSRIRQVEVIAAGLPEPAVSAIVSKADRSRVSEAGRHFYVGDLAAANDLVRMVQAAGGSIVEVTPVRESLEDYFMRTQEHPR